MKKCLISQPECGRLQGNPVCPKCGMDERVVYPGQADLAAAQAAALARYEATQVAVKPPPSPEPPKPPMPPEPPAQPPKQPEPDSPATPGPDDKGINRLGVAGLVLALMGGGWYWKSQQDQRVTQTDEQAAQVRPTEAAPRERGADKIRTDDAEKAARLAPARKIAESTVLNASTVVKLARPNFNRKVDGPIRNGGIFNIVSDVENQITDEEAWFARNELTLPFIEANNAPWSIAKKFNGGDLSFVVKSGSRYLAIYNSDVITSTAIDGGLEYAISFENYRYAPRWTDEGKDHIDQHPTWAWQVGDILYVSHGHRTYASSSFGENAYISAIDVSEMKVLWHSPPLVSNARNFLVLGESIISGYGFSFENDYLYAINAQTGLPYSKIRVKNGPEYLIMKSDMLHVRTYDRDLQVKLRF